MGSLLRKTRSPKKVTFGKQTELIFKEAVANAIEGHRLAGNPIAVLRSNKVVLVPSDQIEPLSHRRRRTARLKFAALRVRKAKQRTLTRVDQLIVAARKLATRT